MGKLAIVFAGQGAQTVGMGKELYENYNTAKRIFDIDETIRDLCFAGSSENLNITINTQPAVLLTDLACAAVLTQIGIKADGVAGFSLGELAAVSYAGMLSVDEIYKFVQCRAKAMQVCTEKNAGGMCAVLKLSTDAVNELCSHIEGAYPVNYNSPGQVVVAYAKDAEETVEKAIVTAGGRCMKLPVSGAFHSLLMNEASEVVKQYLQSVDFDKATIPIYSNQTAEIYGDPKEYLSKQISSPVLWQATIENMLRDGFDTFIEAGPGKTLSGLIKKIAPEAKICNVNDVASLEKTKESL